MADIQKLNSIVKTLLAPGKGLLAADESATNIEKRFSAYQIANTEDNRRAYREMFFRTPDIGDYISGIILFDETFRQNASDGTPFLQVLKNAGILPGIKVDQGLMEMPGSLTEKITKGREGLSGRLKEYAQMGAAFAKWRAVITISPNGTPTEANIRQNAKDLAAYAKACQEEGIVPIVEPEVLMEGSHAQEQCRASTERTLAAVFEEIKAAGVVTSAMILKPNMIVSGTTSAEKKTVAEIADATIGVFKKVLPSDLPGVAFLSGGQDSIAATENLNAINERGPHPWTITFSYSRALQNEALEKWAGKPENVIDAQFVFLFRAQMNSLAAQGLYGREMETA
jgi:fructose-bisphosphate aldolase, class I